FIADPDPATLGFRKIVIAQRLAEAAWALRDAGKDDLARAAFEKAAQLDPTLPGVREALVAFYGTPEEAARLDAVQEERWSRETDPYALMGEGASRLAAGDAAGAHDLLHRAAEKLPDVAEAWFNLGLCAMRLEQWEEAREAMERAARLKPDF